MRRNLFFYVVACGAAVGALTLVFFYLRPAGNKSALAMTGAASCTSAGAAITYTTVRQVLFIISISRSERLDKPL